jgi:hypothetical protein
MPYKSSVNTGLPNIPDPPDPAFFVEFQRVYNAIRNLTIALDSYTGFTPADPISYPQITDSSSLMIGNTSKIYVPFSQLATKGYFVNIHDIGGGVRNGRLASATTSTTKAHGFLSSASITSVGQYGEVTLLGLNKTFGPLTIGNTYYLSNTAGLPSNTPGTIPQKLGFAADTSSLFINPDYI